MSKKVFVSYCWSSPEHVDWVLSLSRRLVQDGVDVVLDKWDLKTGHDKFSFMEKSVHDKDIDKVLIILDNEYTKKANDRSGGVGTETMIISAKVYESVTQEKFIPIVAQRDDEGEVPIPVYLNGRIYIDLSLEDRFESEYEKLLREVYGRPSEAKPKLGTAPRYLFEETSMSFKTTNLLKGFDAQMSKNPDRVNSLVRDFLDEFVANLNDFRLKSIPNTYLEFGELLVNNLASYLPLRNDYVIFIDKIAKGGWSVDYDIILRYFEKLPRLLQPEEGVSQWKSSQFDNFKFIIDELWLYTVAIALKRENYQMLEELLHTKFFPEEQSISQRGPSSFDIFYHYTDSLDQFYNKHNNANYASCQAELLVKRIPEGITKSEFVEADLLCHYIGQLHGIDWFPKTYLYKDEYSGFGFFNRLVSKRYFEKVKGVLGFDSIDAFHKKAEESGKEQQRGYSRARMSVIRPLKFYIELGNVGQHR